MLFRTTAALGAAVWLGAATGAAEEALSTAIEAYGTDYTLVMSSLALILLYCAEDRTPWVLAGAGGVGVALLVGPFVPVISVVLPLAGTLAFSSAGIAFALCESRQQARLATLAAAAGFVAGPPIAGALLMLAPALVPAVGPTRGLGAERVPASPEREDWRAFADPAYWYALVAFASVMISASGGRMAMATAFTAGVWVVAVDAARYGDGDGSILRLGALPLVIQVAALSAPHLPDWSPLLGIGLALIALIARRRRR